MVDITPAICYYILEEFLLLFLNIPFLIPNEREVSKRGIPCGNVLLRYAELQDAVDSPDILASLSFP